MIPNVMRVARSAYYEHSEREKKLSARQLAEIEMCMTCDTEECRGQCEKIKNLRHRK